MYMYDIETRNATGKNNKNKLCLGMVVQGGVKS